MDYLNQIFGSGTDLNWQQECARAVLIFAYGLLLVRLAGRRVFGKWSALDIVVSVIVGSNLSRALTGNAPLFGTLAATTCLLLLHWVLSHIAARWQPMSVLLEGSAVELARDGKLKTSDLRRHAISDADLAEAMRQAGVEHVSNTRLLTLEPSGKISVMRAKRQ